jgi:MraZ protein
MGFSAKLQSKLKDSMDAFFRGRFDIKLDPKSRLSLPTSFRETIRSTQSQKLVVTNGQHAGKRCLDVYTFQEWQELEKKIAGLSQLSLDVQNFQRFYLSGGQVCEADAQFRLLIPQSLKTYASLKTNIVLVGLAHKFEIWPEESWSGLFENLATGFEDTLASLSEKLKDEK